VTLAYRLMELLEIGLEGYKLISKKEETQDFASLLFWTVILIPLLPLSFAPSYGVIIFPPFLAMSIMVISSSTSTSLFPPYPTDLKRIF
jgi:hypothetical protein